MLAFVLRESHAETVAGLIDRWEAEGAELHAPLLAQYEIATGLAKRRSKGILSREDVDQALTIVDELDVIFDLEPDRARAIEIAAEMERESAYDPSYVALAEQLDTKVWTLDKGLARNVASRDRVVLIGSD